MQSQSIMQQAPTVLICGAGPTGLVLAIWLTRAGIPVRIIDAAERPGTTSRAVVVHARTLEFYAQLGLADSMVKRGIEFRTGNIWVRSRVAARLPFSGAATGLTPYPYILIFPQDRHETFLVEALSKLGVTVERNTSLLSFEETAGGVRATIKNSSDETETFDAAYIAGCDGAHSAVRHILGIGFPGGTYDDMFYVADLRISGPLLNGELNAAVDDADFLLIFPLQGEGRVRLIGAIKQSAKDKATLRWEDVSDGIMRRLRLQVEEVFWFSTYHVHHRVADHFRKGRAFLLGDAGHIHSPVGGQGMNTGIGDAVNLAWKLAAVLKDGAPESLLDTYEPERIAFARQLVASTDRTFTFVDKRSRLASFVRTRVVPPLLRFLFRFRAIRRIAFRALSQTRIQYRKSMLSQGAAGRISGGDRLPWVRQDIDRTGERDNFAPLAMHCWQMHCYGTPTAALSALCKERDVPLCVFPANAQSLKAGLKRDAAYVVRPDGYVGFAASDADPKSIQVYLRQWNIGRAKGIPSNHRSFFS